MGDVSHILPTIQLSGLGEVAGTRAHHWTVTAAAGTAIGEKAAVLYQQDYFAERSGHT